MRALLITLLLTACAPPAAKPATTDISSWRGSWTGAEGTMLTIAPTSDAHDYRITIRDLDGPRDFTGHAAPAGITLTRDGHDLTIHAGNGADTGMKWLGDKQHCLIVQPHEGYCRD